MLPSLSHPTALQRWLRLHLLGPLVNMKQVWLKQWAENISPDQQKRN